SWPAKRRAVFRQRAPTSTRRSASGCSRATMKRRPRRAQAASSATRAGMPRSPRSRWPISSIDSMPRTRVETRARARVLQALYAWDLRDGQRLERVAEQIWDDLAVPADERRIAGPLVRTIVQRGDALDTELADVTTNGRLDRLGVIDRSLLRLAGQANGTDLSAHPPRQLASPRESADGGRRDPSARDFWPTRGEGTRGAAPLRRMARLPGTHAPRRH